MTLRIKIAMVLVVVCLIGGAVIVYNERPVTSLRNQLQEQKQETDSKQKEERFIQKEQGEKSDEKDEKAEETERKPSIEVLGIKENAIAAKKPMLRQQKSRVENVQAQVNTADGGSLAFTKAEVLAHNSLSSCWTSINGSVYDLTSWVSRHPGGPEKIMQICGIDGSQEFNGQHENSRSAQRALFLLKIGTLQ